MHRARGKKDTAKDERGEREEERSKAKWAVITTEIEGGEEDRERRQLKLKCYEIRTDKQMQKFLSLFIKNLSQNLAKHKIFEEHIKLQAKLKIKVEEHNFRTNLRPLMFQIRITHINGQSIKQISQKNKKMTSIQNI